MITVAQLAYGRKITGRIALQLFAGPEVTTFRVPLSGATHKISGSGGAKPDLRFQKEQPVALLLIMGVGRWQRPIHGFQLRIKHRAR